MHYRNSKEAKIGDRVIHRNEYGHIMTGRVIELNPGSTTCDILVVPIETQTTYLNSKDCLAFEDAIPALPPQEAPPAEKVSSAPQ